MRRVVVLLFALLLPAFCEESANPLVLSLGELKFKLVKSAVVEEIATPFDTIKAPEGKKLVLVTLIGTAERDFSPAGLRPDAFLAVYKEADKFTTTAAGALNWMGSSGVWVKDHVAFGTNIAQGPVEIRLAIALPPAVERFTLLMSTPLSEVSLAGPPKKN